ncbi:MAG TPA: sugar phosphate isomerase/epimerase [Thermodesulfobacteriaceae bacterium]|nr:sugar phosphate isomerase/epimerase [Thermodesulfobacteriaceae bacterium]
MNPEIVKRKAFICCPFDLLVQKHLPGLIAERINPEIGLNGGILDRFTWPSFNRVARIIRDEGLRCTIHAPFTDLSLGAIDRKIRKITIDRIKKAIDLGSLFQAESIVCHTGFDHRHYYGSEDTWLGHAIDSLDDVVGHAAACGIPVMLENVFELTPDIHQKIFRAVDSASLGFCMDTGHQAVFSKTSMEEWLNSVGDRLGQIHLHDNLGRHDDHLPIGRGTVNFTGLFEWLVSEGINPIFTLEPHSEKDVFAAIEGLARLLRLYPSSD